MSNIQFEVQNLFPGTDKQKNVGIYASFTLNIKTPDGILVSCNDMKLRKRKDTDDGWYVESPYENYTNGSGENKKRHHYKIFPEKENWDKQNLLVRLVRDQLEKEPPKKAPAHTSSTSTSSTKSNNFNNDNSIGW